MTIATCPPVLEARRRNAGKLARAIVCVATSLLSFVVVAAVAAQEGPTTEVTVRIPSAPADEFDSAQLLVNGESAKTRPGEAALFRIPASAGDTLSVSIWLLQAGSDKPVKEWHRTEELNGSGHVIYTAVLNGTGFFSQWPLVVFKGSVPLDVWIDHAVRGTTQLSKGIAPDQEHLFEWKDGASTICSRQTRLPANVTRTWKCNAVSRTVEDD